MLSGYLERALSYLKYDDSNSSRKRNSQAMMRADDEFDYIPEPKRIRTAHRGTEVSQSSFWGSSLANKFNRCRGFFSQVLESVNFNRSQQNNKGPDMESSRKAKHWADKNSQKSSAKLSMLARNPLQQSQSKHYNPFVGESSNVKLPEIINIDDDDDDDCVEIPSSEKLLIPDYNAIYNSEEENFKPSKIRELNQRKSVFLSLQPSVSPKIHKKPKKKKFKKTRYLYNPSMLASPIDLFRQDEKEKYHLLLEHQGAAAAFSSFQEADSKLAPKLSHQKTVYVQTEKKARKGNAFFKVNLTDSDKIHQIKNIEDKRPLELTSWDKKARHNEHVFQVPQSPILSRVGLPSKSYTKLPLAQIGASFSGRQGKSRSTESLALPSKAILNRSYLNAKAETRGSHFKSSDSLVFTDKLEYDFKSLERKPVSQKSSVYDAEFFSTKWLNDLKDNVDKSTRTQSEKAQQEEHRYQILQEEKLAKQFQANRKSLASIETKFCMNLASKYDDSEDEDSYQLPTLTPEMQTEIDNALRPNPPDEVLVQSFGIKITRKDMETLSGLNWLNDEIINFYTNLMMERGKNENYPSCYAFNTFFYPKLISSGHSALKRWTRKIDIFDHSLILIPVHLGMHWCLAVIDFRHKKIQYYDSMGGQNNECLNALKNYLEEESMDKKNVSYDTSDWKLEAVKNIPQQMNGSDCGMFTCKFAEYITRNAKITFSQKDMPYFRRLMVYEIVNKRLM